MNPKLTAEIQAEQNHGRQKYGNGPFDYLHDSHHIPIEWENMIHDHTIKLRQATPRNWRQELVKVAGLACSAIEAFDRRQKRMMTKKWGGK